MTDRIQSNAPAAVPHRPVLRAPAESATRVPVLADRVGPQDASCGTGIAGIDLCGFLIARLGNLAARERGEVQATSADALLEIRLLAETDPEIVALAARAPRGALHIALDTIPEGATPKDAILKDAILEDAIVEDDSRAGSVPDAPEIAAWIADGDRVSPLPGLVADLGRRRSCGSWRGATLAPTHVLPLAAMAEGLLDGHTALHVGAAGRRLRHVCSPRA